jgi:excisionase family DNA binding protein
MRKNVRRHLHRAGHSIPSAAAQLGIGEGTIRRAIDRGQINIIEFGGLRRISNAELERIRILLGMIESSNAV